MRVPLLTASTCDTDPLFSESYWCAAVDFLFGQVRRTLTLRLVAKFPGQWDSVMVHVDYYGALSRGKWKRKRCDGGALSHSQVFKIEP